MYTNPRPDLVLLPCPFCGDNHIEFRTNADESSHWAVCDGCGAHQGGNSYDWDDVEKAWNTRTRAWAPWTESEVALPDPKDEVLVEAGAFRHVSQIVVKERKSQRTKPPYWVVSGSGEPFFIAGTRWVPLPPHRLDEGKS